MNYYEDEIEVEEENLEDEIEVEEEMVVVNTGGTTDHSKLKHLDYENSGHTGFASFENLQAEINARQSADTNLQGQIDAITVSSDIVDIVGTYQELQNYDTTKLTDDDIIKVMQDSTHSNAMSYYRWSSNAWVYVGSEGPFYTKSESDTKFQDKLVSGTNIKSINNQPVLGSGNLVIEGGYPEVPEKLYEYSNLLELLQDETNIPDGIYTVSQEWYCDIPKANEEWASDNINPNSILYIYRPYGFISWSGPTSSMYWSNGDETFTGGVLTTIDDVNYAIDEKLGPNIVMTDTDQDITGIKTIRATDGLKFRYGSEAIRTVIKPISGGMAVAYTNAQGVTDNNFEFSQGYNTSNKTLIPKDNATQDLGKSDRVWNNLYVSKLNDGTNEKSFSSLLTNNNSLIPTSSSVYALGDNTHRWYYLYMSGNIEMQLGDINQVKSITANEYRIKDGNFNNNYYSLLKYKYGTSGKTVAQLQNGIDVNNMIIHNIPDTPDDGTSPINKNYADTNLQGKLTFDSTPTASSTNPVTSGGVFNSIQNIIEVAEGKTASYTLSYATTGNEAFNTQNDSVTVTSFIDSAGNTITDEDVKIGDVALILEVGVPDRWVQSIDTENHTITFYKMETAKIDLNNYVDLTSDQTITGLKTFVREIDFKYANSSTYKTGIVCPGNNKLGFGNAPSSASGINSYITMDFGSKIFYPGQNGQYSLGTINGRWKDLYLSGNLTDGTNEVAVADIADKDYVDTKIGDIDTALQNLVSGGGVQ